MSSSLHTRFDHCVTNNSKCNNVTVDDIKNALKNKKFKHYKFTNILHLLCDMKYINSYEESFLRNFERSNHKGTMMSVLLNMIIDKGDLEIFIGLLFLMYESGTCYPTKYQDKYNIYERLQSFK